MRCLVCHKKVPRLRSWRTKSEFCCDEHAETYKQQTLARLLDERGAPRALELPLPPDEVLEEEPAPSSVGALSSAEASVDPYQQPDPSHPAEAGSVLTDEPRRAYAREEEAHVGAHQEHEASEEARIGGEERVSAPQEREDKLIPSFSELEGADSVTGVDPFERLASLRNEELAKLPSSPADAQLSESGDLREEIVVVRGEQTKSDALDALESTPGRDKSPITLEQDEGETEEVAEILHLLGVREQDQAEARKLEQVVKDTDLLTHIDGDPQSAPVQGEQPIDKETGISASQQSSEEDEVGPPVSTDKTDPGLDTLLEILNRPSGSGEIVEPESREPKTDQPAEADSESSWSPRECRPFTELVNIDELAQFAPDRDDQAQEARGLGSGRLETGISGSEVALGVPRPPLAPESPRALATNSAFASVPDGPLTHPQTFEPTEPSTGANQAYGELGTGAPRATAPSMPQAAAPLALGSPNPQSSYLAPLWPTTAEGAKQQSKRLDVELRSEPHSRFPADGSRVPAQCPTPGRAFSLQPFLQATGELREIGCGSSNSTADGQETRPVHSAAAAEEKTPTIRIVVGSPLLPISLSAAQQGTVSVGELLPESVDLASTQAAPTSSPKEFLDALGPLWTASLAPPHRAIQLKTSSVGALWFPGIACSEVTAHERVPQFTQEPGFGAALAGQELMLGEPSKPIAFTFSTATLGSMGPEPQGLLVANSVPANLAEAVGAHQVSAAAERAEVFPAGVRWISLDPSRVAKDTFYERLPETKHGPPLTLTPEAHCDVRQLTTEPDWRSAPSETQRAFPFAWYVMPAGALTMAFPKPLEETLEGRNELRADVIVSKVECRLPSIGGLRYRLSGSMPTYFDRLASEDSWLAYFDLPEAAVENAYEAEAEVFSKSTADDVRLWIPPKVRLPVEAFPQFNSGFELVGEVLPRSAFEGGVNVPGSEEQNEVRPKARSRNEGTARWNGKEADVVSAEPVGPLLKVRSPSDLELWDFS